MRKVVSLVIAVSVLVSLLALAPMAVAAPSTGWTEIVPATSPDTMLMFPSVEFQGKLYFWVPFIGVGDDVPVWSYDGTTLEHAAPNGFDGVTVPNHNIALNGGIVYQGFLYMSTLNADFSPPGGGTGQIWRTDGIHPWERFGASITAADPDENSLLSAKLLGE